MKIFKYDSVESTNIIAKEKIIEGNKLFAILANYQTSGHGRNNKIWVGDKAKNIYLSIGIKHNNYIYPDDAWIYQSIGCLSVLYSLRELFKIDIFKLKYPNDILAFHNNSFKKLSGVIVLNGFIGNKCDYSIIGIGVNVNQENFQGIHDNNPISLKLLNLDILIDDLVDKIIYNVELFIQMEFNQLFKLWHKELNIIGKNVELVNSKLVFKAVEILKDGRLILENTINKEKIIIDNGDSIRYEY